MGAGLGLLHLYLGSGYVYRHGTISTEFYTHPVYAGSMADPGFHQCHVHAAVGDAACTQGTQEIISLPQLAMRL